MTLPPGTLLQHMYLRERLRRRSPGRFVKVGVGRGELSNILLDLGWTGIGYDVSDDAVTVAGEVNGAQIAHGKKANRTSAKALVLYVECEPLNTMVAHAPGLVPAAVRYTIR